MSTGQVVFDLKKGYDVVQDLRIPCGQCIGCRLERSRQWAMRCIHEASLYEENCFITLTYSEEHLPDLRSLDYTQFQLFMKRVRKRYSPKRIRFFMCGEYGDEGSRPHYHACLFNHNFEDRKYFKTTKTGSKLYTSEILEGLWPFGMSSIGDVTFESAAYVARYIMKKVNGRDKRNYEEIDRETGEVNYREKEFAHMSLKPGLGSGWWEKWKKEVFPHDRCIVNGQAVKPPKYYYLKLKEEQPYEHDEVAMARQLRAEQQKADNTDERLLVKEEVLKARLNLFKRESPG